MKKTGGCGCNMEGGRHHRTRKHYKKGGSMIGDALLAGSALGLYSYFTKKTARGGRRVRKTKKAYI